MRLDKKSAVILIAGFALHQLLGPYTEHLRGLVDGLVIAELLLRVLRPEKS